MQSVSIFFFKFVHPCFLLYLLLFIRPSFYVLSGYFYVSVNLVAVSCVWIRYTAPLRVLKCLSPHPHRTYPFVFENEDFFPSGLSYRPPVSGENGQRKSMFSNRSPEPRFSKTPFDWLVWMEEKRIRRGVGSTILPRARDETKCPCSSQRRYRFQSLLHFRLDGKKRFKNATWWEKRRKKISTFKQKRIRVNGD